MGRMQKKIEIVCNNFKVRYNIHIELEERSEKYMQRIMGKKQNRCFWNILVHIGITFSMTFDQR